MGEAVAFTPLLDRSLPAEVRVSAWCPTMDLLALATADGQVAVQRLTWQPRSWQQLWSVTPEADVTSLCWQPDGKALAVGHCDGGIALLDVENGEPTRARQTLHQAAVVALSWVDGDPKPCLEDRSTRFFSPPPPPLPEAQNSSGDCYTDIMHHGPHAARWPPLPGRMSVIVSADESGRLLVSAYSASLLASLNLGDVFQPRASGGVQQARPLGAGAVPLSIAQSADLCQVGVLAQDTAEGQEELKLAVIDTSVLAERGAELQYLSRQADRIAELMDGALQTLHEANKQWAAVMKQPREKWRQLEGLLADHASMSSPQQEFMNLLATGMPSAALLQFLSSSLGEAGTKRLAKSVDAGINAVHDLLLNHLTPALEMVAFCLGELHGVAQCTHWMTPVCLEAAQLKAAEQECIKILVRMKQVLAEVSQCGTAHRSFFMWLLRTILLLNYDKLLQDTSWPISTDEVTSFLNGAFNADALLPELEASERSSVSSFDSAGHIPEQVAALQDIVFPASKGDVPVTSHRKCPLMGQAVLSLHDACARIFTSVPEMLSSSMQTAASMTLVSRPADGSKLSPIVSCCKVRKEQLGLIGACIGNETRIAMQSVLPIATVHGCQHCALSVQGGDAHCSSDIIVFLAATFPDAPDRADCTVVNVSLGISELPTDSAWAHLGLCSGKPVRSSCVPSVKTTAFSIPAAHVGGASFYKDGKIAILSKSSSKDADISYNLEVVTYSGLKHSERKLSKGARNPATSVLQGSSTSNGPMLHPFGGERRIRSVGTVTANDHQPLTVSGPRGLGCLLSGQQRVAVFDLEEDEELQSSSSDESEAHEDAMSN
mmetsp:Transcript_21502/g.55156  ORF Transcript_21502/g.55156 Transcript_21502/m.55156 type:complete len:831 (+) Transcript_21502:164-2656(+)